MRARGRKTREDGDSGPGQWRLAEGGQSQLAEAERQLAVAEAFSAAENVSDAYGYYIDEFIWNDCSDLFAVNGRKELSYIGTYIGRERIRKSMIVRVWEWRPARRLHGDPPEDTAVRDGRA